MSALEIKEVVAKVNPDDYQDPLLRYYAQSLNIELKPKGFSHDGFKRDKIPLLCQSYRKSKQSV